MENYPDIPETPKKGFTIGKLFKWLALFLIAAVYAILIARCTMYKDDKLVSKILVNDTTREAYLAAGDTFSVRQYGMNSAWVAVKEGRLVEFNKLYHLEAARQLQISVKYNKDIATAGQDGSTPFTFYLTDENGTRYEDYFFEQANKFQYVYLRLCFEGIDLVSPDAELNENGVPIRKKYTLHMVLPTEQGEDTELCRYEIYDGSDISKVIDFDHKF